jgi:hypothetical protein
MIDSHFKLLFAIIGMFLLGTASACADPIYSNTMVTAGLSGFGQTGPGILLDQVIVGPGGGSVYNIGRVDFGVENIGSSPVIVTGFYSEMLDDGTPVNPIAFGNIPLAVAPGLQIVTVGDGSKALFTVTGNTSAFAGDYPGKTAFYIGLELPTTVLWQVADSSNSNPDSFWLQNPPAIEGLISFGGDPLASFYLSAQTTAIPEPLPGILVLAVLIIGLVYEFACKLTLDRRVL